MVEISENTIQYEKLTINNKKIQKNKYEYLLYQYLTKETIKNIDIKGITIPIYTLCNIQLQINELIQFINNLLENYYNTNQKNIAYETLKWINNYYPPKR